LRGAQARPYAAAAQPDNSNPLNPINLFNPINPL